MLSKKDITILTHLRQNSRIKLTLLSKKTGIPIATLFDRIKATRDNVITKFTTIVDFSQLGYSLQSKILLSVGREDRDNVIRHLVLHNNMNNVCRISNGHDIYAEGIFMNIRELEDFLDNLESKFRITKKEAFFLIEDAKREGALSDPELLPKI